MKKNHLKWKRLLCLFLAALMALSVLTCLSACADIDDNKKDPDDPNGKEDPQKKDDEETVYKADLPDGLDLGKEEFRMLVYDESNSTWYDVDFNATEITSDTINDAAFRRLSQVEENLNVDIVAYPSPRYGLDYMSLATTNGDDLYDAGLVYARGAVTLAETGSLLDLKGSDMALDINAPWWDQNCVTDLSLAGHLYMTAGDISILYRKSLRALYFNKEIAKNANITELYDWVDNKEWTIEALGDCSSLISEDLNGDDKMDKEDRWGLIYSVDTIGTGLIGAGVRFVSKDEDDYPELCFYDDETVFKFEQWTDVLYDREHAISFDEAGSDNVKGMFMTDQALFISCELHNIMQFRSMETDFGILPNPLADEDQESYYSIINPAVAGMLVIPITNQNLDNTCYVLDALGAASKNELTPAYIDVYLEGKSARDEESKNSLNIIFNNVIYDLGYIYNWGNIATFTFNLLKSHSTTLSSSYGSIESTVEKKMEETLDNYRKLE